MEKDWVSISSRMQTAHHYEDDHQKLFLSPWNLKQRQQKTTKQH